MKEKETAKNLFKRYEVEIKNVNDHYEGCSFYDRPIPIDECTCDCYVKKIFNLGRQAERDLFYNT